MPHIRFSVSGLRVFRLRGVTALVFIVILGAMMATPAAARQKLRLSSFDFDVRMGDVPPPRPPFAARLYDQPERRKSELFDWAELPEETDRVERTDIPNRQRGVNNANGIVEEGSLLEELLEGETIPLFRVTVESPF